MLGIHDAIHVGVIDAESGHVRDNSSREVISLADALDRNIVLCKPLPIVTAIDIGLLNETTAKFLDPSCRKFFSLAAAVDNGLIDSDSCFTDPATGRPMSVALAMSRGVLDAESACVTNVHTGDIMTLREAITAAKLMPPTAGKLMSVDEAISLGLFDQSSNVFIDPHTKEELTLEGAVAAGLLDGNSIMTDAATGRQITVAEMLNETPLKVEIEEEDKEQVNVKRMAAAATQQTGQVEDETDMAVADAVSRQGDGEGKKLNMPLHTVLQMGLFCEDSGQVENPETHELMTVQAAFDSCLIDNDSVKFKHPTVGLLMSFQQSVESELVDPITGDVVSPEGDTLTLKEAVGEGLVITATTDKGLSLVDVVQQGVYDPVSGRLTHPFSGVEMTVREGIQTDLIDINKTRVCVPDDEEMSTDKAISQNLINTVTGRFQEPDSGESVTLGEAITKNYLIEVKLNNLSVDEAVDRGIFDVKTGIFADPVSGKQMNITEAIRSGLLDPRQTLLTSPDGSKMLTLDEAIAVGMVDASTGELINMHTGERMSFVEATDKGLVLDTYVPPMMSFTEACRKGLFDRRTGNFSHPVTGTRMNFEAAISNGLIDPEKCQLILPGSGEPSTLATAIDENLVDDKFINIVDLSRKHAALLVDALSGAQLALDQQQRQLVSGKDITPVRDDRSLHRSGTEISEVEREKWRMDTIAAEDGSSRSAAVEDSTDSQVALHLVSTESDVRHDWLCAVRGMTLCDVINSNLFDRDTCSLLRPGTNICVSLADAVVLGILDFSNVAVHNFVTGQVLDFHTACENGLVDLIKGSVYYPAAGSWLDLVDAIDQGIVYDATEGQTTLLDLVDRGVFDVMSGMFVHPQTEAMMNMQQSVECGLLSAKKLLLVLPETHEGFTLQFAMNSGLADMEHGVMTSPITGKWYRLVNLCGKVQRQPQVATNGLTLKQAAVQGLLNAESRRVRHPLTGEWLTLAQAVDAGVINAAGTLVKDCRTGDIISLSTAIEAEMVDTATADMIDLTTGSRNSLFAAVLNGLGLSVQEAVSAGLFNNETGKFVNPDTGEELTLHEAIDAGMIDASSSFMVDTNTGLPVTLAEALSSGMVDSVMGNIMDIKTGTLIMPNEGTEGGQLLKMELIKPTTGIIKDTTSRTFTEHEAVRAGVAVYEATKSPLSIASTAGPHATASKPKMTLNDALQSNLFDGSTGLVTDPTSGRQMTVVEAIRSGIIDADASWIVNPSTGQTVSLSEGLRLGIVNGKSGKVVDHTTGRTVGLGECVSASSNISVHVGVTGREPHLLDLKSAIDAEIFNLDTGAVRDPQSGLIKSLADAIRDGLIDPHDTILLDPLTGTACTLQDAVDNGIVLPDTGMVYDKTTGKLITFADAMKAGILVLEQKSSRDHLVSLEDAISSGLFDSRTGTFLDSSTNERVPFREALGKIVDVSGIGVRHPETNQLLSLEQAISDGLVNAETDYFNAATGSPVSLQQAMMLGYVMGWMARELTIDSMRANTSKSLESLMQTGQLDLDTGLVYDSAADQKISIENAVKRGIINRKIPCTYDAESGTVLSIEECIRRGLIDITTGKLTDPSSGQEQSIADIFTASHVVDSGAARPSIPEHVNGEFSAAEARKSNVDRNEAVVSIEEASRDADAEAVEVCVSRTDVQQSGPAQEITGYRDLGAASLDASAAPAAMDLYRRSIIAEPSQVEVKPAA